MAPNHCQECDEAVRQTSLRVTAEHPLAQPAPRSISCRNVLSSRIQQHTRHKSAEMMATYVRKAGKWTKSGLKGVGF